jgi:hypothetical protein
MPDGNIPTKTKGEGSLRQEEGGDLKRAIDRCVEQLRAEGQNPHAWLMTLYKARSERMLSDNERIWKTGNIFVPISLSAFAALLAIKDVKSSQVLTIGLASFALIWFWIIIAENHRAFQQKSDEWLVTIQKKIGINYTGSGKVKGNLLNRMSTSSGAVQGTRWALAIGITAAWVLLYWQARLGRLW